MRYFYKILLALLLSISGFVCEAQKYSFTFEMAGRNDEKVYICMRYRDTYIAVDSALRNDKGIYLFKGERAWLKGVYSLTEKSDGKLIAEFCIENSLRFTISGDKNLNASSVKVKGDASNKQMFDYLAVINSAKEQLKEIKERQKTITLKAQADKEEEALNRRMARYQDSINHIKKPCIFLKLVFLCDDGTVPDAVANKPVYFRQHYWDNLFSNREELDTYLPALLYSPQLYNKLNYFFFGMLYHHDSDTICYYLDRLMGQIGGDKRFAEYVLEHITPRYFRSTRNIGWDAVWCHIAQKYYLSGYATWAKESTIYNMKYNYDRISRSIIGKHGVELLMADTNQSPNPKDWISSHRFPEKYVILWFWDPDCQHCQKYTAELKVIYDSMVASGKKRFEVYAVGYESDVDKWKRYVKEHDLPFVNVGGPNVNVDYQEMYNVHGAPTMIILNEKRDIIMNKVLPMAGLMRFLDEYEQQ